MWSKTTSSCRGVFDSRRHPGLQTDRVFLDLVFAKSFTEIFVIRSKNNVTPNGVWVPAGYVVKIMSPLKGFWVPRSSVVKIMSPLPYPAGKPKGVGLFR